METSNYPKLKDAILLCILLIVLQFVYSFIFGIIAAILNIPESSTTYRYATTVIQIIAFTLPLLFAFKKINLSVIEVFHFKRVPWPVYFFSFIFITGFLIISSEIDNVLSYVLPMTPFMRLIFDNFLLNDHIITVILLVIVIPGLFEEFLFRGIFLHGFTKSYSPLRSIIYSSVLFGLIHLNPWQFVGAFLIGLFSAWIFIKTKSIIISILLHMLNNGVYLITTHFPELKPVQGFNNSYITPTVFQPLWFDSIGVVLSALGLYLLIRYFKNNSIKINKIESKIEISSNI